MRLLLAFVTLLLWAYALQAQENGPFCRVTILRNTVDIPQERRDGIVLMRVFASTSSGCQSGQVRIAAFPTDVCRKEPATDLNNAAPMTFSYKPAVLELAIEPGNINSGVIEISSDSPGSCSFNAHIESCTSVVPPGGRCVTRDLTEPRPEDQGAITEEFNRLR